MATTLDTCERIHQRPEDVNSDLDVREPLSGGDGFENGPAEPAGYIVYLTELELFEAYPRAKRENPGAIVHFERHDDDLWSLEVYTSEAARLTFLDNFFERRELVSSLTHLGLARDMLVRDEVFGAEALSDSAKAEANASGRIGPP